MRSILGALAVFSVTLVLLEAALWLADTTSKSVHNLLTPPEQLLPDPVFGLRLNPEFPGHDRDGFRNALATGPTAVVALGDSQTYGSGVAREQAWPQQIAMISREPVYNMGVPSYGPVQSLVLMDRAIERRPRWVVEAFYAGNDSYDAYYMVYGRNQIVGLKSRDPAILGAIDKAERENPMATIIDHAFQTYSGNFDGSATSGEDSRSIFNRAFRFLGNHSRLWRMLRAARREVAAARASRSPDARWSELVTLAQKSNGQWIPFEKRSVRTVFVPGYRLPALNMNDPRIREGLRVSIEAIERMSAMARNSNVKLMVILIPTKESVFFDALGGAGASEVASAEREMWTIVKNELGSRGISYLEMLPTLRDSLLEGESPYPIDTDGHPNPRGHKAIAVAVSRAISLADGR